jgi:YfiH family protein
MITIDALSRIVGVRHGFFTRNGAGENFGNLNCAYRNGDDENEVSRNRASCAAALGARPERLITVKQRHTAEVLVARAPLPWRDAPVADAIVTAELGLALGVLTADCAPVLLAARNVPVVAAAHAGWRGAFDGVLENTLIQMEKLGARRDDIVAAIGPCIGAASYEVGPEFVARFVAREANFARYFAPAARTGHSLFDLAGFAADRLRAAGVREVSTSAHDTCRDEALFFSYRRAVLRAEPDYGRQMSLIVLEAA